MRSDWWMLWYLLNKIRWWWASNDRGNTPAFWFDWTDDYISSNATIGRTGYDMNVSGNVSTGSDTDGSYFWINWNRDQAAWTWTQANLDWWSTPLFDQTTSFTISTKVKINSLPANNTSGIFASNYDAGFNTDPAWNDIIYWLRGSSTVQNTASWAFVLWTAFWFHQVYDSTTAKFYGYINGVLQNVWWTAGPATFSTNDRWLWDNAITGWNVTSCDKQIYHAAIRNKALTQAEIDADIALWNTAKNDPSIVAYYIPENLQYNTQYMLNSSDFSNASRTKTNTTVTADTTVAPDGTTTADTLTIWLWATSWVTQISTVVSGATVASKVFIVKAFVKVSAATSLFRLVMYQNGVATWTSANLTATTDRQEFTFTQTFTASASATGITWWIINDSTWLIAPVIIAWKCRVYLTNETLRDESPNIWWFIWWKTPLVMSARIKPWVDASNTTSSQVIIKAPRHYLQLRWTTNIVNRRSETALQARIAWTGWTAILWTWNRDKVNIVVYKYRDWTGRLYEAYVNGVKTTGTTSWYSTTIRPAGTIYTTQLLVWKDSTAVYYTWNIRDSRIYTFTWSFTDADALAIYNGGEPTSVWVTKYLHYKPLSWEIGTATSDLSTNLRDWTLNNWVTRTVV